MYSLVLRIRPQVSSRILTANKSFKKINKLDHFNEFGDVLPKEVLNANKPSNGSTTKLNHFNEFGPPQTADVKYKNKRTIKKAPIESFEDEKMTKLSGEESVPLNVTTSVKEKKPPKRVSQLFNPGRLILSPGCSSESIIRVEHQHKQSLPSVTRILSATMSEESKALLARWEKEKIALLGEEGFRKYKAEIFSRGKFLHNMLETFLETRSLPHVADIEDEVSKRHRVSISQMIANVGQPLAIESSVSNTELGYSGIVDCVAVMNNTLTLIDWKTSEKVKNNVKALYDNPLQLAAYIGAINSDSRYRSLGNITTGAVVVVYNSGYPAMTHTFNESQLGHYWNLWCERLHKYNNKLMT